MYRPKTFIGPVFPRWYHRKGGFQGDPLLLTIHQVLFHPTTTSKKGKKYPASSIATKRAIRDGRHYAVWEDKGARKNAKAILSKKWKDGDDRPHARWSEGQKRQRSEFMKKLWDDGIIGSRKHIPE